MLTRRCWNLPVINRRSRRAEKTTTLIPGASFLMAAGTPASTGYRLMRTGLNRGKKVGSRLTSTWVFMAGDRVKTSLQRAMLCPCGNSEILALGLCSTCYTLKRQDDEYYGGLREAVLDRDERRCRDLIAIDEVGYVPMAELGAEFLFQVIAERAEQAAVILTTNLPFSEWTQVIPNARLCKALLDRITDRAHILETGADSYLPANRRERKGQTYGLIDARAGLQADGIRPPLELSRLSPSVRKALLRRSR